MRLPISSLRNSPSVLSSSLQTQTLLSYQSTHNCGVDLSDNVKYISDFYSDVRKYLGRSILGPAPLGTPPRTYFRMQLRALSAARWSDLELDSCVLCHGTQISRSVTRHPARRARTCDVRWKGEGMNASPPPLPNVPGSWPCVVSLV